MSIIHQFKYRHENRLLSYLEMIESTRMFPGARDLQIQHSAKSNARTFGMASTTVGRYAHDRSNSRAQTPNNQQSGLGQSVSQTHTHS